MSLSPMAIFLSSRPEDEVFLTYPKEPTKYKERIIIKTAREFRTMPICDVRVPKLIKTVVDAREDKMMIFRDLRSNLSSLSIRSSSTS